MSTQGREWKVGGRREAMPRRHRRDEPRLPPVTLFLASPLVRCPRVRGRRHTHCTGAELQSRALVSALPRPLGCSLPCALYAGIKFNAEASTVVKDLLRPRTCACLCVICHCACCRFHSAPAATDCARPCAAAPFTAASSRV
ncbi:hypothetical protein MRX96_010054 [Rhipicephalus microplus]